VLVRRPFDYSVASLFHCGDDGFNASKNRWMRQYLDLSTTIAFHRTDLFRTTHIAITVIKSQS
jgi:hypothetical protein